jgi:hypothetical protein
MRAELFEIVQRDGYWVILFAAALRKYPDKEQSDGPCCLFWTGGTWRADSRLAMKFSDVETATTYIARSVDRMLVKSTFTRGELRRKELTA